MERPGIEPPLCAQSTNRSLYAIYSQIPVDNCVTLHRRMTKEKQTQIPFGNDKDKCGAPSTRPFDFAHGLAGDDGIYS
jgi:hypothetical protein